MSKFWKFIKNEATENTPESVELRIEGNIVDSEDAWIYEWFGIPCASPNYFRNELAQYAGKNLTVWIDSYGGSVFAAAGMYNALMEHKKTGAKITTKADSKVMSAATIPFMAGDERLMSPMAIFMMHNPLTEASGYASDLRKVADVLDVVKETIINAYELGTGSSREEISNLMDEETYMSAKIAVQQGFATGILYSDTLVSDKETSVLNFAFNRHTILNSADDALKHFFEFEAKNPQIGAKVNNAACQCEGCSQTEEDCKCSECGLCQNCCDNQSCCGCGCQEQCNKSTVNNCKNKKLNKGGKDMVIKNAADLKNSLPEVHKEVYNSGNAEGIKAERERLKAFDVLNGKVDPEFLNEEKYKDGATAESILFKAMQEGKLINSYVTNAVLDAANANKVPGSTSDNTTDEESGILNFVKNAAEKVIKGGK